MRKRRQTVLRERDMRGTLRHAARALQAAGRLPHILRLHLHLQLRGGGSRRLARFFEEDEDEDEEEEEEEDGQCRLLFTLHHSLPYSPPQ
jgi:hypothetical protein